MSESDTANTTQAPAPETRPRKKRRLLKMIAALAVLLIIVLALLPYIIPAKWLGDMISQAAKSHIKGEFAIGAVSWGWLGGVQVDGITIGDTPEFGGGTFVRIERVNVHVSLLDLLRKRVTVKSVTVRSPDISLSRNAAGAWNYEKVFAVDEKQPPVAVASVAPTGQPDFDVAVERVRVENGTFRLDDRMAGMKVSVSDLDVSVDADFSGPTITGDARLSLDLVQGDGKARIEVAAADLNVPKQASASAAQQVSGRGTITLTGIDIGEALAQSTPQIGPDLAKGKLTLAIDYEVSGGKVKAVAKNGAVKQLVLGKSAGFAAPVNVGDVSLAFDVAASQAGDNTSAMLNSFALGTSFADVAASGRADITKDAQSISAKASGSMDPAAIPKGLVELPPDLATSGRAKFEATYEGAPPAGRFAATVDAGAMKVAMADSVNKAAGTPAGVSVSGQMLKGMISAEKVTVTLAGAAVNARGTFDTDNLIAAWDVAGDFSGLNVGDYYPGGKNLKVVGKFANGGKFLMTTPKRQSQFSVDSRFDALSLDVTDKPGIEVAISGAAKADSERAELSGLVINMGGTPVTVDGQIITPLARPNGKITVRGKDISIDGLMAVAESLQSAVPTAAPARPGAPQPAAPPPAGAPAGKTPAEAAEAASKAYINNANVNLDLAIDRVTYQQFTGTNLVVDAGLVGGKALVRKATVNVFGGTVDITSQMNLAASDMPFDFKLMIAKVRASDAASPFASRWFPGLPLSNMLDVNLSAGGRLGGAIQDILSSVNGKGNLALSNGTLSFGGTTSGLAALLSGLDMGSIAVPSLNLPLDISNGRMMYSYAVDAGDYKLHIDVDALLTGRFTQKVAITPPGGVGTFPIFSIENGKRIDLDTKELAAAVARSQVTNLLRKELEKQTGTGQQAQPSTEPKKDARDQAAEQIGGAILDILTRDKEKK